MASVNVTVNGIDSLTHRFNNISKMNLRKAMSKAVSVVHAQAKALAPVDTGNLAGSIHMDIKEEDKTIIGRVYTNLQYAPYVEFGTGIKGNGTYKYKVKDLNLTYRNSGWVYTPDGGDTFYYTEGQVAQPYMYPALKENESYIKKLFNEEAKAILKANSKGG